MTAGFVKQISKHLINTTAMLFSDPFTHLGPFGSFSFREIRKISQRIGWGELFA